MSTQTPLPSPPAESLAAQLRLYKTIAVILLAVLVAGGGYAYYLHKAGQPAAILVDGKLVAVAPNVQAANAIILAAVNDKLGPAFASNNPVRLQRIVIRRVPPNTPIDTDSDATQKLSALLKLHVHAYAILVNGHVSVGFPTTEMAADALHIVKEHFAQMPPNPPDATIVGEPTFIGDVEIKHLTMGTDQTSRSAAAAAPIFWTPPPSKMVAVKLHDTGWSIARRNHISLADFIAVNSGRDLNRLHPGDMVKVSKPSLNISVRVTKQVVRVEKLLQGLPEDEAGKGKVTYLVTYIDGVEAGRQVAGMTTIQKARTLTQL